MTDVELLDPHGDGSNGDAGSDGSRADAAPAPGTAERGAGLRAVAAVAAAVGGGLAVDAPFHQTSRIRLPEVAGGAQNTPDGWGRVHLPPGVGAGQHGPRLGIACCVAAALVLIALVLWFGRDRRRAGPRSARLGSSLLLVAAGGLVSTVAATVMNVLSSVDNYRVILRSPDYQDSATRSTDVSWSPGGFVWCGLGAALLLFVAVIARAAAPATASPADETTSPPEPPVPPEPVAHHDDEVLG